MKAISAVVDILLENVARLNADNRGEQEIEFLGSRFNFTVSQQAQLQTLIQSWFALTEISPLAMLNVDSIKTSKALIKELQRKLDDLPVKY